MSPMKAKTKLEKERKGLHEADEGQSETREREKRSSSAREE
ncbi:hypothetical protein [Mesobacillus foraminis]|nr:hypothetical protein [Mesobacillus foraminis]